MKDRLQLIYLKIQALVDQNQALSQDNAQLRLQLSEAKTMLLQSQDLNNSLSNAQLSESISPELTTLAPKSHNYQEIKARLDQYIEELEQCIQKMEKL